MLLNYDFVFLAMLLARPEDRPLEESHRCPICPLRKKRMCMGCSGLEQAADEMVILSWWKLRDTVEDNGFFRGLPARILLLLLKRSYRKAESRAPVFAEQVQKCLAELAVLERERCPSIDRTADTFARILEASVIDGGATEECRRALKQLLYHVGRWIYLVDAVDDLEEDTRKGRYNPISLRFPEKEGRESYLRINLRHSLNLARGAFELLPHSSWSKITENILYLGLPMVEEAVFTGQWKKLKK